MSRSRTARALAAGIGTVVVAAAGVAAMGCSLDTSLERLMRARRLSADLSVRFSRAADASNRAVMADTDDSSGTFAREAEALSQAVQQGVDEMAPLLTALRYGDESRLLEEFRGRFVEYRALDRSILQLAVEGTNQKAQRLSFGAGREAADAFRDGLIGVAAADAADRWRIQALVNAAVMSAREIQVLQAPHIAEADDAAMTRLEAAIGAAEAAARTTLRTLEPLVDPASRPRLAAATAAFDRFIAINAEIVVLSRRNTNVRSLALSLNQKRLLTAACDESLRSLDDALAKRGFTATR